MPQRMLSDVVAGQDLLQAGPKATVMEAVKQMDARNVAAILVIEQSKLVGIFTERDLLKRVVAKGRNPTATKLADAMTPNPITISATAKPIDAIRTMQEHGFRHLPVADGGKVVGIVSLRDFVGDEIVAFEREANFREHLWEKSW